MRRECARVTVILALLGTVGTSYAADFAVPQKVKILNVTATPSNAEILPLGHPVEVFFTYSATEQRYHLSIELYKDGQRAPGSTRAVHRLPKATANHTATVTVGSGRTAVDEVRVIVVDVIDEVVLGAASVPVDLFFAEFPAAVHAVEMAPPSGVCLQNGETVSVSLSYQTPTPTRITVVPRSSDVFNPGTLTWDPPVGVGVGAGQRVFSFTVNDGPGVVQGLDIRLLDRNTQEILLEERIPVVYGFAVCETELTDVEITPASPACLELGEEVSVSFRYTSFHPVRVEAIPILGEASLGGYITSSFSGDGGSGSGEVRISADASLRMDRVLLRMHSANGGGLLAEVEVPVDIRVGACHTLTNFDVSPAPEADVCLEPGDKVSVSMDYWAPQPVRIRAVPMAGDGPAPHLQPDVELLYASGDGNVTVHFAATGGSGRIDRVAVQMWDQNGEELLHQEVVNATYDFGCNRTSFRRGDTDNDGKVHYMDAFYTIFYLYVGNWVPPCMDAADIDDNGVVDAADPVLNLVYFFFPGTFSIPAPGRWTCGEDPTIDEVYGELGCQSYPQESCN